MSRYAQLTKPSTVSDKAEAALKFAESAAISTAFKNDVKVSVLADNRSTYAPAGHRRLTINLPEELHKLLRMRALERNTTATEIVEQLLLKELSK